ncbi:MAG: hypothetical protein U0R77_05120 [Mycolicibacterium insubricum]|nr:hypothetical protein [Mycobacterium sp.]
MASASGQGIGLAPVQLGGALKGFVVSGRWPDSTKEWAQLLIVTVRIASVPGLLSTPTLPECAGAASGCVLLPGLPHLGLDHRAAWMEAESDGTVTSMVSRVGIDPIADPDTAVLAMLLAS